MQITISEFQCNMEFDVSLSKYIRCTFRMLVPRKDYFSLRIKHLKLDFVSIIIIDKVESTDCKGGRALSPFFGPLQKPKYESYRTTISSTYFIS